VCVREREREYPVICTDAFINIVLRQSNFLLDLSAKYSSCAYVKGLSIGIFFMQVVYAVDTDSVAAGLLLFVFHFSHFYFLTCFFGCVMSFFVFFFWCVCVCSF